MVLPCQPLGKPHLEEIEPDDGRIPGYGEEKVRRGRRQGPNPLLITEPDGIVRRKRGNIIVDEEGMTALRYVYAGGDVATGAATVILAIGTAKKAAHAIDRMLRHENV